LLKKRGLSPIILLPCSSLWTFGAAIMLVNQGRRIEFWNSSLPRLLGFKTKPPAELQLEPLPLPGKLRSLIVRCHRSVLPKQQLSVARGWNWVEHSPKPAAILPLVDIHCSVIQKDERSRNASDYLLPSREKRAVATASGNAERVRNCTRQ